MKHAGSAVARQFCLAIVVLLLTTLAHAGWSKQTRAIMGTEVLVELWHTDDSHARECSDRVFAEMQRINDLMSPYRSDSELSLINQDAAIRPVPVSSELYDLIEKSLEFSILSGGVFDITFASVGHHYDYRERKQPTSEEISSQLGNVNYRLLNLAGQKSALVSVRWKNQRNKSQNKNRQCRQRFKSVADIRYPAGCFQLVVPTGHD